MDKLNKKNSGQSLVELIVAVSISALILVALLSGVTTALHSAQLAKKKTQAMGKTQEVVEWLRGEKEKSWAEFATNNNGQYCFNDLTFVLGECNADSDGFKRQLELIFTDEDGDGIDDKAKIKVTTFWTDNHGEHKESLTTYLTKN